jgi:hypothetical protein
VQDRTCYAMRRSTKEGADVHFFSNVLDLEASCGIAPAIFGGHRPTGRTFAGLP